MEQIDSWRGDPGTTVGNRGLRTKLIFILEPISFMKLKINFNFINNSF